MAQVSQEERAPQTTLIACHRQIRENRLIFRPSKEPESNHTRMEDPLSQTLDQIGQSAGAVAAQATQLGERVRAEGLRQLSAFHEIGASTNNLVARIDGNAEQRRGRLQDIRARVTEMRHHLSDSLSHLDAQAHEIEQSIHLQRDHLDDSVRAVVHAQESLHADLESHASAVAEHEAHVVGESGSFVHEVEEALDQLREHVSMLHGHLTTLDHEVVERVTSTVRDLQHLGERSEHLATGLAGRLHLMRGRFQDSTRRAMIDEAVGALESSSRGLHDSLDGLGRGTLTELQHLEDRGGGLIHGLEDVVRIVDAIRPVLEMVHFFLG